MYKLTVLNFNVEHSKVYVLVFSCLYISIYLRDKFMIDSSLKGCTFFIALLAAVTPILLNVCLLHSSEWVSGLNCFF